MNGFLSAQSGIWSVFFIFGCALSHLGFCPWYFSLDTKANPAFFVQGIILFSWQRGALSDFGVPFRGSSRRDNRLSGRIGTTNTNGLQEELCSRQSTHTCTHTRTHTVSKTLPLSLLAQAKDQRAFCIGKMFLSFCNTTTTDSHSVAYGQWMPVNIHMHPQLGYSQICEGLSDLSGLSF